jgi:DNA polymerase-3 subunit alpha
VGASFTHLHQHTEFSMLDGAARVPDVIARAASDGQPAMGITDHGNMYGVLEFYKAARDAGIKPIIGTEAYMAGESRFERPVRRGRMDDGGGDAEAGEKLYYHLTLLAETNQGYKNLLKLSSEAYLEGYFYKPRCDWELLQRHHQGIVATTGCLGGVVLQALLRDDFKRATELAARLQDIFGRESLFVELQDHGLPEQARTNPELIRLAQRIQAPLLATNDSHYVSRSDAEAHDALLCVQTGSVKDDPKRFRFHGDEHYLKTAAEMRHLFRDYPEACDNTLWIAERANVEIEFGKPQLPSFPRPPGFDDADSYLRHLAYKGAAERYGSPSPDAAVERLEYELGVISDMGFSDYFLVVWDLIRHARESGIRVGPGRGSAAGCCVAYCLRIVDLDPIRYNLLFERFLNPGRKQMPDIDMDFDERYRSEMIRYAAERYGWDRVAQIVTFSTIKARAAVRDAARVLGYPYSLGDRVAKLMPPLLMGRDTPLWACLEEHPKYLDGFKQAIELRELCAADPDVAKVVGVAQGLEGLRRQDGIHAAAVVISAEPLTEYLPIQRKPEPGGKPEDAPIVTQYEMNGVEELGLLKMDFLGLRNLSVIERTLDLIEEATGDRPDIDNVALDDPAVFEMLSRADTIGIFQLEGGPMRNLVRSLAPTAFEDVAALVALYRPGPMAANMHNDYADRKNGRKPVVYQHPDMEEALGDTYGLCLTGDTLVHDVRSGRPVRLDQVDPTSGIVVQGVDDDLRPVARPVTHWVCNGQRDTVRVVLANGMSLTGTPDHPVLTETGWARLGDLRTSDHVAVARQLLPPLSPSAGDPDRLLILGYLLADGGLSNASTIGFTNTDEAILKAYAAALQNAFPGLHVCEVTTSRGVHHLYCSNGKGHGGGASPLLAWLRDLGLKAPPGSKPGGVRSGEKFVPDFVFGLPDDQVAVFLAALWDCDGYVGARLSHYRTISPRLAEGVQRLLLRLGIESSVYRSEYIRPRDGKIVTAHQVTVYDGGRFELWIRPRLHSGAKAAVAMSVATRGTSIDRRSFVEAVAMAYPNPKRPVLESAGIQRWHLSPYGSDQHPRITEKAAARIAEAFDVPGVERWLRCSWVDVAAVEPAGTQTVYDITVEGIHNFVANGIVAHNCIYQEQMMLLATKFAGYSLAEADNLRKAAGKKVREIMAKEREKFEAGCVATGYGAGVGKMLFDIIEPFADYGFNRSHAFGYGYVSYQTAWLKAHYPAQYLASLLTSVKDDKEKTAVYLAECRGQGIEVLVPDINVSSTDFAAVELEADAPSGTKRWVLPFGLSAIRNVGEGLVERVIGEREAGGAFTDFYDFCSRVDPMVLNKRTVESLIKAGAFDSLGHPRQGLCLVFEQIVDRTLARRREAEQGVMSLFGDLGGTGESVFDDARVPVPDQEFDKGARLAFEKEMLGLYLSDHPLKGLEGALARHVDTTIVELREQAQSSEIDGGGRVRDGETRWVGGVITGVARKYTKRGDLMATFLLEDLVSNIDVWVFPRTMTEVGHLLADDVVVCVKGRLDLREEQPKLICMEIKRPELSPDGVGPLHLTLPLHALTDERVESLKLLLTEYPGPSPVLLHVGAKCVRLASQFSVDTTRGLLSELKVLLGPACLHPTG